MSIERQLRQVAVAVFFWDNKKIANDNRAGGET